MRSRIIGLRFRKQTSFPVLSLLYLVSLSACPQCMWRIRIVKAVGYNQAVCNEMHVHGSETFIIIRIETR